MSDEAKGRPLTGRQQRFVEEYLVDLNATKAAIRADYSAKTAYSHGQRLLKNVEVQQAISGAKAARSAKTGITQERVLTELEALAHSSVTHYQVNQTTGLLELAPGAPANAMAAISSIKYRRRTFGTGEEKETEYEAEFKLWDKPGTLKLAGRHVAVKGFFEKVELSGPEGGPVPFENLTTAERLSRLNGLIDKATGGDDGDPGADEPAATS